MQQPEGYTNKLQTIQNDDDGFKNDDDGYCGNYNGVLEGC